MTPMNSPEDPPTLEDSRGVLLMPSSTAEESRAALLIPPSPPEPGTIRVLIAAGCTWTSREVPGATQLDITLVSSSPSARHVKSGPQ